MLGERISNDRQVFPARAVVLVQVVYPGASRICRASELWRQTEWRSLKVSLDIHTVVQRAVFDCLLDAGGLAGAAPSWPTNDGTANQRSTSHPRSQSINGIPTPSSRWSTSLDCRRELAFVVESKTTATMMCTSAALKVRASRLR